MLDRLESVEYAGTTAGPGPASDEAPGATGIVPRATVATIVRLRNEALVKYDSAYGALTAANQAIAAAHKAAAAAAPDHVNSYNFHSDKARKDFLCRLDIAEPESFTAAARRLTDIAVWSYIIEMTELETVMDKEAKDELRAALNENPPDVTVDNVFATLERFVEDAGTIWRRGLANCFSKLDRRFRSHSGWKIGSRIIMDYAFGDTGHWSYRSNHQDSLIDIERVFFILDGRTPPQHYCGILQAINAERGSKWGARQSTIETEFFKLRVYKNGNCHLWFQRDDLVEKANKVLAEYYGEVLADSTDEGDDSDLFKPKTSVAKNYGHFPTPAAAADELIKSAGIYRRKGEPLLAVLEPSAGAGNLARPMAKKGATVDCVEIQAHLAQQLEACGIYRSVTRGDFITLPPRPAYDRIVMNPPFNLERDIDHVMHALNFLKPDGLLVAIMSAGTEWRESKKARAFRDRMAAMGARWRDLPAGSFAEVGTNVNTVILRVWKDGRTQSHWW